MHVSISNIFINARKKSSPLLGKPILNEKDEVIKNRKTNNSDNNFVAEYNIWCTNLADGLIPTPTFY